MRVLVVEDDTKIATFVSRGLTEAGMAVDEVHDGNEGLARALGQPYDVIIVDVMLPGLDGFGIVEALRRRDVRTPVLILSARRSVEDRVRGLQLGSDDYLVKPFAFPELLARVQALARRASPDPAATPPTRIVAGDIVIDMVARRVERAGKIIELRPREFALLVFLARNADRVVSKTMIMSEIWNLGFDPRTNIVDVLVHRLREKLDRDFEVKRLQTVRGVGYVLHAE